MINNFPITIGISLLALFNEIAVAQGSFYIFGAFGNTYAPNGRRGARYTNNNPTT